MRGVQKSKRVSWATDGNLCQVRLFLSEDSPSLAGTDIQDHLQAKKKASVVHGFGSGPDDALPPGFEGVNNEKNKLVRIPLIKWRCPPSFALDAAWRMVAGEGSKEVETQNVRELRVLEAIYPRSSTIPPDPQVALDIKNEISDDRATALVPITPIEEEEGIGDFSNDTALPATQSSYATSTSAPNLVENGDLSTISSQVAAATAALSAVVSSNEPGKMIDHELLIKILSNPTMLENLAKNHGHNSNSSVSSTTASSSAPAAIHDPPAHHSVRFSQVDSGGASSTSKDKFFPSGPPTFNPSPPIQYSHAPAPPTTGVGMPSFPGQPINTPPLAKDLNYYKSLIYQHGGDRHLEASPAAPPPFAGHLHNGTNQHHNVNPSEYSRNMESKPKIPKPCAFFNTPKGCRHGANCLFQHDGPMFQQQRSNMEMQAAKRIKTDNRETRGPPQPYF